MTVFLRCRCTGRRYSRGENKPICNRGVFLRAEAAHEQVRCRALDVCRKASKFKAEKSRGFCPTSEVTITVANISKQVY